MPVQPFTSTFAAFANVGETTKAIAPRIGNVFLAASLKNSLLFWVSLFLSFPIFYCARLFSIWLVGIMFVVIFVSIQRLLFPISIVGCVRHISLPPIECFSFLFGRLTSLACW